MLHPRRLGLAFLATCLVAALFAAPNAMAAGGGSKDDSMGAYSAAAPSNATLNRRLNSIRRRTRRTERRLAAAGRSIAALADSLKTTDGKVNLLLAAAPQLVDGLTQLRDASLQLKAGLETAGTSIKQLATSQEYGQTAVFVNGTKAATFGSADIPDDGNTASATGLLPVQGTAGDVIEIRSSIKSGETDGHDGTEPAGQVGGLMYVKCANIKIPDADGEPGCGNPAALGGNGLPAGAIFCSVGPTPGKDYTLPDGQHVQLNLKDVSRAAPRSDSGSPVFGDVNPLSGAPATGTGDGSSGTCTIPSDGVYEVVVQTQFVDIPTSLSPGLTD